MKATPFLTQLRQITHFVLLFTLLFTHFFLPAAETYTLFKKAIRTKSSTSTIYGIIMPNNMMDYEQLILPTYTSQQNLRADEKNIQVNPTTSLIEYSISKDRDENTLVESKEIFTVGYDKVLGGDAPQDNVFTFDLENEIPETVSALLSYDLYGVGNSDGVTMTLNSKDSKGGYIIKKSNTWSKQEEFINSSLLKKGKNYILFTSLKSQDLQYKIKNLKIIFKNTHSKKQSFVINQNEIVYKKDNLFYLSGFISSSTPKDVLLEIDGKEYKVEDTNFEFLVPLSETMKQMKYISIVCKDKNGILGKQVISIADNLIDADVLFPYSEKGEKISKMLMSNEKVTMSLDGVSLEIKDSSITEPIQLFVKKLRDKDIAPLEQGMFNVTNEEKAYRFLPDGVVFKQPVAITMKYDKRLIPEGYSPKDIKTYYFDVVLKSWQPIPVVNIDEVNETITSLTTHFTDYINGIIKVPENPESNSYVPTTISGIQIANPGEKVNLIEAPQANQQGDANLSYPLEIPAGRGGMQPSLQVSYSSSNQNGWMGLGWNLSIPSIELDTRWGSPTFDSNKETEIYMLEGEQLLLRNGTNSFYLPNKGNTVETGRIANAFFYERVEGAFKRIQRMGNSTTTYYWEVTDKTGTKYTYGGSPNSRLTTDSNHIARWMLNRVEDIHGNYVDYFYTTVNYTTGSLNGGKQLFIDRIEYTKHTSNSPTHTYTVKFLKTQNIPGITSTFTREDKQINARLGFKEITDHILEKVIIEYNNIPFREYRFTYKQGQFKKTLLHAIKQYDGQGQFFNEHVMSYYDYATDNGGAPMFGDEVDYNTGLGIGVDSDLPFNVENFKSSVLGSSHGDNWGGSTGLTLGIASLFNPNSLVPFAQEGTAGITGGISGSNTKGKIAFVDITGDGLPDKVYKSNSNIVFNKNNGFGFDNGVNILTNGLFSDFSKSKSTSKSLGFRGTYASTFAGYDRSWSDSDITTYLEDVNGDGLIDVISNRRVAFNSISSNQTPSFTLQSSETPNVIYQNQTNVPTLTPQTTGQLENSLYDIVKVWEVPYEGTIKIMGTISLTSPVLNDGIKLFVEKGNVFDGTTPVNNALNTSLIPQPILLTSSNSSHTLNINSISVQAGQRIYFRINANQEDLEDLVSFNPEIEYTAFASTSNSTNTAILNQRDANGLLYLKSSANDGFILSKENQINIIKNGNYSISWDPFVLNTYPTVNGQNIISDEVEFIVKKHTTTKLSGQVPTTNVTNIYRRVIVPYTIANQEISSSEQINTGANINLGINSLPITEIYRNYITDPNNPELTTLDSYCEVSFSFEVRAFSNVDWKLIDNSWRPKITLPVGETINGENELFVTPKLTTYENYVGKETFVEAPSIVTSGTTLDTYVVTPAIITQTNNNTINTQNITFPSLDVGQNYTRFLYITLKGSDRNILFTGTTPPNPYTSNITQQNLNSNVLNRLAKIRLTINPNGTIGAIHRYSNSSYSVLITDHLNNIQFCFNAHNILNDNRPRNNRIYFEYYSEFPELLDFLDNINQSNFRMRINNESNSNSIINNTQLRRGNRFIKSSDNNPFGPMYRGWGQFAYKTEANTLMKESEMVLLTLTEQQGQQISTNVSNCINNIDSNLSDADYDIAYQNCINNNVPSRRIMILNPDKKLNRWQGSQPNMYASSNTLSPRKQYDETNPTLNDALFNPNDNNTGAYGIIKYSKSTSNSISAGPEGLNIFTAFGKTEVLNDYRDINGDRYPDFIDENGITLTNNKGNVTTNLQTGFVGRTKNESSGVSMSGTLPKPEGPGTTAVGRFLRAHDLGGCIGVGNSTDATYATLMDINGDGLTDRVDDDGAVKLNYGQTIETSSTDWLYGDVNRINGSTFNLGATVSFFNNSLTAGIGGAKTNSSSSHSFVDLNGDGLPDKINYSLGNATVLYNLGDKFGNPTTIQLPGISTTSGSSVSASGSFTICGYFLAPFISSGPKFCSINSLNAGLSIQAENVQFIDLNGDGYQDILRSDKEEELKVRYSNIGKTNMLKTVQRPLGSTITLDYAITNPIDGSKIGNTYKMPFSKWALTKVSVFDGYTGDGEDEMTTQFEYFEGVQDRRERAFLGFGIVKTHLMTAQNAVYRTQVTEYATIIPDSDLYVGCLDNRIRQYYYKKGIVSRSYMLDGLQRMRSETRYVYKYYNPKVVSTPTSSVSDYVTTSTSDLIATPTANPNNSSFTDNRRVLPLLVETISKTIDFENDTPGAASHTKELKTAINRYDKYGNVKEFLDRGASLTDATDDLKVTIQYFYNSNHLVIVPREHRVVNQGVTYRFSRNFVNSTGLVIGTRKYLTTSLTSNYSFYEMVYDVYGNVIKYTLPKGALSDAESTRMVYNYQYDNETKTYVTEVSDSFGYVSSTTYLQPFGVVDKTVDINQVLIKYIYDSFGRLIEVYAPDDSAPTIANYYFPLANPPYAVTSHLVSASELYTATFIDGLSRVIQTKKELANCECTNPNDGYRFSVSGATFYDEFGRVVTSYLNQDEKNCSGVFMDALVSFSTLQNNEDQKTEITYDFLDRPLTTTEIGGLAGASTTSYAYGFGEDRMGQTQFKKQVTAPLGGVTTQFLDNKGRVTSSNQIGDGETYWTSFSYNKLHELIGVQDAIEAVTTYTYDNFGRKTSVTHPDAGLSTFTYDLANRLIKSRNANLIQNGQEIIYSYDKNQLIKIDYPTHQVLYKYGIPGAPDNGAGRIVYQEDMSGIQYFKYNKLGAVSENIRKMVTPQNQVMNFVTRFTYDNWGRLLAMIYPDGEELKYTYDTGGMLTNIVNTAGQSYLQKMCYDVFEKRTYVKHGNQVESFYTYEPQQALSELVVKTPNVTTFMQNRYSYDLNNNVTQIQGMASATSINGLGGTEIKEYGYDQFDRLKEANGSWTGNTESQTFSLAMEYNAMHSIITKNQQHVVTDFATNTPMNTRYSMNGTYNYTGGNQPHAVNTIDIADPETGDIVEQNEHFYDASGNLQKRILTAIDPDDIDAPTIAIARTHFWDEQNRLKGIVEDNSAYHYVYDAQGERVLKSAGSSTNLIINGELVENLINPGTYTLYPSGFVVVSPQNYTKHYFIGSERIASRLGNLQDVNYFQEPLQVAREATSGVEEKAILQEKIVYLQKQFNEMTLAAGLGKATFRQSNSIETAEEPCLNEYNIILNYWSQLANSGNPDGIACLHRINTWLIQADGNYCNALLLIERDIKCNINPVKDPIWWYHPDHLGSSSYLTNSYGMPSHYYNYLPFGEEGVSQNQSEYNNVYRFSAKELDDETQLSYFGARYYDARLSYWLSVDPLWENGPEYSPYCYSLNNPMNFVDPDGRWPYPSLSGMKKAYVQAKSLITKTITQTKQFVNNAINETKKVINDSKKTIVNIKNKVVQKTESALKKGQDWVKKNKTQILDVAKNFQETGENATTAGLVAAVAGAPVAGVGAAPGLAMATAGAITSGVGDVLEIGTKLICGDYGDATEDMLVNLAGEVTEVAINRTIPGPNPDVNISTEIKDLIQSARTITRETGGEKSKEIATELMNK